MDIENIHNEYFLKGITNGKNPFKTPENYFKTFSEDIHTSIIEEQFPTQTGFSVPTNYFKEFKVNTKPSRIIQLIPYISIAAAILVGFFIFNNNSQNLQLSDEEVIQYLTYQDDIEYNEIINNIDINMSAFLDSNLDNTLVNIDQLSLELNEYDIVEF
ncbi:hypothetical protein Q4595_07390 [Wenyingzhuangia sp. 1_MG-2023]|nr:hypothetical protein [Wenyingzhuangia sp. 1_MG-2023]